MASYADQHSTHPSKPVHGSANEFDPAVEIEIQSSSGLGDYGDLAGSSVYNDLQSPASSFFIA